MPLTPGSIPGWSDEYVKQLLSIEGLTVHFETDEGIVEAVNDLSMEVNRGEIVGLVGESGSGKTVTAQSVLRLLPRPPAKIVKGNVFFNGNDLLTLPIEDLRKIRGAEISMIFQEPMTALSPLHRVGHQLCEILQCHAETTGGVTSQAAWKSGEEWLEKVGLPEARERMYFYPHHLSGGMRQRVMIAMALMLKPKLIIADEPSTALDVTVQAQIFKLLMSMKDDDTSLLLITHDLAVVWELCDRIYVMKNARLVESGKLETIFKSPAHEYTRSLLNAAPRLYEEGRQPPPSPDAAASRPPLPLGTSQKDVIFPSPPEGGNVKKADLGDKGDKLIRAEDLRVWFPVKKGLLARTTGPRQGRRWRQPDYRKRHDNGPGRGIGLGKNHPGKGANRVAIHQQRQRHL